MKITELNLSQLYIGVFSFENYHFPRLLGTNREVSETIIAFQGYLCTIEKISLIIEQSIKISEVRQEGNCIGENEALISYEDGFFKFYNISLGDGYFLELEKSIWFSLLEKIKQFMIDVNFKNWVIRF